MYAKMYLTLNQDEHKALQKIATQELRGLQEQVRFIIRKDLERRGLLETEQAKESSQPSEVAA